LTIYCQVNETDYESGIVIEAMNYYDHPAVPPWEEWGQPELAGPFTSWWDAFATLARVSQIDPAIGIWFNEGRDCPPFDR